MVGVGVMVGVGEEVMVGVTVGVIVLVDFTIDDNVDSVRFIWVSGVFKSCVPEIGSVLEMLFIAFVGVPLFVVFCVDGLFVKLLKYLGNIRLREATINIIKSNTPRITQRLFWKNILLLDFFGGREIVFEVDLFLGNSVMSQLCVLNTLYSL